MKLEDKNVVVIGGAGFIGSHLCDKIVEQSPRRLLILDDFSLGTLENITHLLRSERVNIRAVDASDFMAMSRIYKEVEVDVTFNLAVIPLPASLDMPKECIDRNILITSTLCELLRKKCYDTLIHTSSSEAYGTAIYDSMDEDHPTKPITPYAASKLACDHIALSYYRTFGLNIAVARPFNTFGPRQNLSSYAAVIPLTIRRILAGEAPVIHGDGQQTRDFSDVDDVSEGIIKIYESPDTRGKIVNLASGVETTIEDLIHMIMEIMDYTGKIKHTPPRQGDVRRHLGNVSLARKLIDYRPETNYIEGLKRTIEYYRGKIR